jgi:hypothetical protein
MKCNDKSQKSHLYPGEVIDKLIKVHFIFPQQLLNDKMFCFYPEITAVIGKTTSGIDQTTSGLSGSRVQST